MSCIHGTSRRPISVDMPLDTLKQKVAQLSSPPAEALLAEHARGSRGSRSAYLLLSSLVASEEARLSNDADIKVLFEFNDKLAPLAEKAARRFRELVPRDRVNTLVEGRATGDNLAGGDQGKMEWRRLKAQLQCLQPELKMPSVVFPRLPASLVQGIQVLSEPCADTPPENVVYWFLSFWRASIRNESLSGVVRQTFERSTRQLLRKLHQFKERALVDKPSVKEAEKSTPASGTKKRTFKQIEKTPRLIEDIHASLGTLQSVNRLFLGVDYRSRLLDAHLPDLALQREKLRLQILDMDVDLHVLRAMESETNRQIVAYVSESAKKRRQADLDRKRDGFDEDIEGEFSLLQRVDELLGPGCLSAVLRRRQAMIDDEVEDSNLCDEFKRTLRTQLEATRVIESPLLEEAERTVSGIGIEGLAEKRVRATLWAQFAVYRRDAVIGACERARVSGDSRRAIVDALDAKSTISEHDMSLLVTNAAGGDPALPQMLEQICKLETRVYTPDIDARVSSELKSSRAVDKLKYKLLTGTHIELHCRADIKSAILKIQSTPSRRRELLYLNKRDEINIVLSGRRDDPLSARQIEKKLDGRTSARALVDSQMAQLCSDSEIEARFEACHPKTDDLFHEPYLFKESIYLSERPPVDGGSLDYVVRKRVKAQLTGKEPYFYLLPGDFSVDPGAGVGWSQCHPSWGDNEPFSSHFRTATDWKIGHGFSVTHAKFQQLHSAKEDTLAGERQLKLEQHQIISDVINRAPRVGPLPASLTRRSKRGKTDLKGVRDAMLRVVPTLPQRMAACVMEAVRVSSFSSGAPTLRRLSFLVDVDAFFLLKQGGVNWTEQDVSDLSLCEVALLAEWALAFLKGEWSPLSGRLGRPPLVYSSSQVLPEAKNVIEEAPPFPPDFSYESMSEDGQLSAERVHAMARWALVSDSGGGCLGWEFALSPVHATTSPVGKDVSALRARLADDASAAFLR